MLFVKKGVDITPASAKKHVRLIQDRFYKTCIFVQDTMTSHNRKRLIQHHIPFMVPGNQMFLPDLGIDLREVFYQKKGEKEELSPAAQATLIYILLNVQERQFAPSNLALSLGYSLMTMSRVFNELEALNIGRMERKGKNRFLTLDREKKELWENVKAHVKTPVKKRFWVKGKKPRLAGGISALAKCTMVTPPSIPVYAMSEKEWKASKLTPLPDEDEATFQVEVWAYDPMLFHHKGIVDPFSLYLSLRESEDERVEGALEELMEQIQW